LSGLPLAAWVYFSLQFDAVRSGRWPVCEVFALHRSLYLVVGACGVLAAAHLLRTGYRAARHRQAPAPRAMVFFRKRVVRGTGAEVAGLLRAMLAVSIVVLFEGGLHGASIAGACRSRASRRSGSDVGRDAFPAMLHLGSKSIAIHVAPTHPAFTPPCRARQLRLIAPA
jgi:hypothetical protein